MQAVEPSPGLVNGLADIVSREPAVINHVCIIKRIMVLGERHCPGVKPAVYYLWLAAHLTATVRAGEYYLVDIRPVQVKFCAYCRGGSLFQFAYTADAFAKTGTQVAESIVAVSQGKKPDFELPMEK